MKVNSQQQNNRYFSSQNKPKVLLTTWQEEEDEQGTAQESIELSLEGHSLLHNPLQHPPKAKTRIQRQIRMYQRNTG